MEPTRWNELEEALASLLERTTPVSQQERLEAISREDPALAKELRTLLDAHSRAPEDLDALTCHLNEDPPALDEGILGTRVGAYEITRLLGHGGMGAVFEGQRADGYFQRRVAIKFLPATVSDEGEGRRFLAEGALLARLDHPNVVSLLDAGVLGQRPYLVMEYLEARDLLSHCQLEEPTLVERVDLLRDVCRAVSAAHQCLVVHLDLKPTNILVDRAGRPKLVDFGVARMVGTGSGRESGLRALTPAFASPEQLRGEPLTTASDLYSLGRVLQEILGPAAPADLVAIAAKAMAESPAERYGSVDRLEDDLRRYRENLPVEARELPPLDRFRKWIRRNRAPVAAGIVVLLSLIATTLSTLRTLETVRANEALGWYAHGQALRFAGLLQSALVDLPEEGNEAFLEDLEKKALSAMQDWEAFPEAKGRTHEALGVAWLRRRQLDRAREHLHRAMHYARNDPGFDGSDLRRLEAYLAELSG